MFKNFASPLQLFTEPVGPVQVPLPVPSTSNGIGERFVPCTHQVLFQANATVAGGQTAQEVFWYNIDTGAVHQLTTENTAHYGGFMFQAPDFNDQYILITLSQHLAVEVYKQTGTNDDGSPSFSLDYSIPSPDQSEPYMNSVEPFIHCTPTCTTYVFTTLAKDATAQTTRSEPLG